MSTQDKNNFHRTDSDKSNQIAPGSPSSKNRNDEPQTDAAYQSADNDMDRKPFDQQQLQKDADEAQSDGDLSFPEGK